MAIGAGQSVGPHDRGQGGDPYDAGRGSAKGSADGDAGALDERDQAGQALAAAARDQLSEDRPRDRLVGQTSGQGLDPPSARDRPQHAVRIAIELRDPALAPVLRGQLAGPVTPLVARALLDLGVDRADLTEPVLRWLTGCDEHDPIVEACTDLLDRTTLPRLRDLADSDERVATGGDHSSAIWRDERHRDAVLAGIAAIEARA